jgi:hypothetical protein
MEVLYSPQRSDNVIVYGFSGDIVSVTLNGQSDIFDFTSMPNGEVKNVTTTLPVNPIVSAERVEGVLRVTLLYFHGVNASHDELFPQWQVV